MTIHVESRNGVCRALVTVEMTIYYAAQLKEDLLPCLELATTLELDLSQVRDMDTAGFQLLLLAKREAERAEKKLHLVAHSPATQEVLNLYNMAAYFDDPPRTPGLTD